MAKIGFDSLPLCGDTLRNDASALFLRRLSSNVCFFVSIFVNIGVTRHLISCGYDTMYMLCKYIFYHVLYSEFIYYRIIIGYGLESNLYLYWIRTESFPYRIGIMYSDIYLVSLSLYFI